MQSVLITGGAGYIGSHVCKHLAAKGIEPVVFDNLSLGHRDAVKWGPLVVGDILDSGLVLETMERYRPAAVMHFAALSTVGESVANPDRYYRNNIAGTISLLNAMAKAGVRKFVLSSTCAIYGVPDALPITEDAPARPVNPYGRTKHIIEMLLDDYTRAFGINTAALRYYNACGADASGEIGERHDPETHLIPRALMAAAGTLSHLDVFGTDYDTPDGTCIRDYIHVTDLAEGHLLALDYLDANACNLAVNLGVGNGLSVYQVLAAIEEATGRTVPLRIGPRRAGDPPVLFADPTKAKEVLGFVPARSDIGNIVRTAWNFMQRIRPHG
ncbi:MAG TPA: UDP-glucose 4-epimerase GalE [Hyphomicrobiaceae bacterium]|nr:UDP-glucose 4-epimerase GalE [Hyphomicrobiaceae bacterium]